MVMMQNQQTSEATAKLAIPAEVSLVAVAAGIVVLGGLVLPPMMAFQSIVGVVLCPLGARLGYVAIRQCDAAGGVLRGRLLGVAAKWLGIAGFVFWSIWLIAVIVMQIISAVTPAAASTST